jgi:biotin synthase
MLRTAAAQSSRSFLLTRSLATHTATTAPIIARAPPTRHDWTKEEIKQIYHQPLLDLVFRAACVHRQHHDPSKIQLCTLMNIKSEYFRRGGCRKNNRSESDLQVEAVAKTVRSIRLTPVRPVLMFTRLILLAVIEIHNCDQGFPSPGDRARVRGCS